MTSLTSVVRRGDIGPLSPVARRVAIVLAILVPLLIAGVAVTALRTTSTSAPGGTPALPAAVVNNDQMVQISQNGAQTPFLAGKLLVSELTSGTTGGGFTWNVTDASTAASGLQSGQYAAVVTIPANFSSSYVSISSTSPVQAQLQVQTNGANSYVTGMLATALSSNLQSALSAQATKQFVTGTLSGLTTIQSNIAQAASGASDLNEGAAKLATGAGQLSTALAGAASGSVTLNGGAQAVAGGLQEITNATTDLPTYAQLLADGSAGVTTGIGVLKDGAATQALRALNDAGTQQTDVVDALGQLSADAPTLTPAEIQDRIATIQASATGVHDDVLGMSGDLGWGTLGGVVLEGFSGEVTKGQQAFADDLPELTTVLQTATNGANSVASGTSSLATGLGQLASGSADLSNGATQLATGTSQLASGLNTAAASIPSYTAAQQDQISTVVSDPILTQQQNINALPTPAAAIAAVAVPFALWLGAFAIYLILAPFTRRALASTASTFRVVISAFVPAMWLALIQSAIIAVVLAFLGADPLHTGAAVLFSVVMSLSFVMLHQGLIALFGQAGRLISLGLAIVQVAAAAVIIPNGLSSPVYTGLATLLPLSHGVTGMQTLLANGSLTAVGQEALALLVFAAIGLALGLIAVIRRRGRSIVVVPQRALPPSPHTAAAPAQ